MTLLGASVTGRLHLFREANAQDAFAIAHARGPRKGSVGVVCDGCGAEPRSEVGAALVAHALARAAVAGLEGGDDARAIALGLGAVACRAMTAIAAAATGGGDTRAFVREHLLTTALALIDDGETLAAVAWGDGVVALDEDVLAIDEDGAPAYLAYALLSGGGVPVPSFSCVRPSASVTRAAIATDGVPPELVPGCFGHRGRGLQRFLNVLGRARRFDDDATVIVRERAVGGAS